MASKKRVYLVQDRNGNQKLVRAFNRETALAHVAKQVLRVWVPNADELVECAHMGLRIEEANLEFDDDDD